MTHEAPSQFAQVPLRQRSGEIIAYALVDPADLAFVNQWTWRDFGQGYVGRIQSIDGKRTRILLHRVLLGPVPKGFEVDHINGNRRDNRRGNLRIATRAENAQNIFRRGEFTSRFRGVNWDAEKQKWRARVHINYRSHFIGLFESEEEAGAAASAFRSNHLEFSNEARA